jgi:RimJ/RimL family protein N-acetyltransferase
MTTLSSSPLFTGKYIFIRHIAPTDALLYHNWLEMPIFLAYKPYLRRLCPTPVQLAAYLAMQAQSNPRTEFEVLVIQQNTQTPIGVLCLSSLDEFNQKAEFSVGFISGYGTRCIWEAIHAGIVLCFANFKLHKLICYVTPSNQMVLKIMQRCQFIHEGYFQEEILVNDEQRIDLHRFALMSRDWQHHPLHQRLNRIVPINESFVAPITIPSPMPKFVVSGMRYDFPKPI